MKPTNCEECDCQQYAWNGGSAVMQGDPPSTCRCGHFAFRHVFRDGGAR